MDKLRRKAASPTSNGPTTHTANHYCEHTKLVRDDAMVNHVHHRATTSPVNGGDPGGGRDTCKRSPRKIKSEPIHLNVGGVRYFTTTSTLQRYPNSKLADPKTFVVDEDKTFCLDRDGILFRHILNFLRTSELQLPVDFVEHDILLKEAEYYNIQPMMAKLRTYMKSQQDGSRVGKFVEVKESAAPGITVGLNGAYVVLQERLLYVAPFRTVPIGGRWRPNKREHGAHDMCDRVVVETNYTRLEWAELLKSFGWVFMGTTSFTSASAGSTNRCHILDKWFLPP